MWLEILTAIAIIGTPITIGIVRYTQKKFKCVDVISKSSFRTKKALRVLANRLDDIDTEQHGKSHNLGPEIELILKDEREQI